MTPADLAEGQRLHELSKRYLARKDTPSNEECDGHMEFTAWLHLHAAELLRTAGPQRKAFLLESGGIPLNFDVLFPPPIVLREEKLAKEEWAGTP